MTYYYYIASDQPIKLVEGHLDAVYIDEMETFIKGFDSTNPIGNAQSRK